MAKLPMGKCKVLRFGDRVVRICRTKEGNVVYKGPYKELTLTIGEEEYKE